MHPLEIQCELKKLGFTQRVIADALGVSDTMVYGVITGRSTSYKVAARIAELIGRDLDEIWPGRYNQDRKAD